MLRRTGQGWRLRFAGHEAVSLTPVIGYAYLGELLRFPGKRFTVSELVVAVHGDKAAIASGDGGKVLDDEAKLACARRLSELDEELEVARGDNDIGRQAELARQARDAARTVRSASARRSGRARAQAREMLPCRPPKKRVV